MKLKKWTLQKKQDLFGSCYANLGLSILRKYLIIRRLTIIFMFIILSSCLTPKYNISIHKFKSNRELWGLSISVLKVDSLNVKGFPVSYQILVKYEALQKGDHESDEISQKLAESDGLKWKVKKYGYQWEPQKVINFNKVNKYYSWWGDNYQEYDTLPLNFRQNTWYLLKRWQDASAGGGKYNLFVFVNDNMEFEKHFDIKTGGW